LETAPNQHKKRGIFTLMLAANLTVLSTLMVCLCLSLRVALSTRNTGLPRCPHWAARSTVWP